MWLKVLKLVRLEAYTATESDKILLGDQPGQFGASVLRFRDPLSPSASGNEKFSQTLDFWPQLTLLVAQEYSIFFYLVCQHF
jgi:hypothetical protein